MKTHKFLLLFLVSFIVHSCSKENGNTPVTAHIRFLHAVPGSILNATLDNTIQLASSLSYDSLTPYISVNAGTLNIKITDTSTSGSLNEALINLNENNYYTLIAADSSNRLTLSLLTDKAVIPDTVAGIRFLHLANIIGAVDLRDATDTVLISSSRYFNDQYFSESVSNYYRFAPGSFSLNVNYNDTSIILKPVPAHTYIAGKHYTVVLHNATPVSTADSAAISIYSDE